MFKHNGGSIVERVSAWRSWFNPGKINGKRAKEGARYAHGVSRGSEVLKEIRQRGFCGGTRTSDLKITFKNCARNPGGSENNRG
jgi:hypothetical protein